MLLFSQPPSIFVTVMTFFSFGSMTNAGISELRGKHLQYSKLLNWNSNSFQNKSLPRKQILISSKVGMFSLYAPSAVFGIATFVMFPDQGLRFLLLRLALTIHFLKRVLEVLFVHKFGDSQIALDAALPVSLSYLLFTITMIYTHPLLVGCQEPSIDLKYIGVGLFLLGIGGNFYHHYLLSKLRKKGEKEYKIPKRGLFSKVICPHYLFEVLGFVGVSCISQTTYAFSYTIGATLYLIGRSYATKKWYLSKFDDFPKSVKAMIPYIF